jgi:hypothetical protein
MSFPRDELWFRKVYQDELAAGTLTRIFKPGNRIYPESKGFMPGECVKLRILEAPGNDKTGALPLLNGFCRSATIENIVLTNIDALTPPDFIGASRDIHDTLTLRYHLGIIYDKKPQDFKQISIIDILYK